MAYVTRSAHAYTSGVWALQAPAPACSKAVLAILPFVASSFASLYSRTLAAMVPTIAAVCILALLALLRAVLAETGIVSCLSEQSALQHANMQAIADIFRLGSGATGSPTLLQTEPNKVTKIVRSKSPPTTPVEAGWPKPGGNTKPVKAVG